jgi:hypothetical protein
MRVDRESVIQQPEVAPNRWSVLAGRSRIFQKQTMGYDAPQKAEKHALTSPPFSFLDQVLPMQVLAVCRGAYLV